MSNGEPAQWIVATEGAKTLPAVEILTGRGFITGKSGSGKSVLEGTPVHTDDGRKPIEDVTEGEEVLSLNRHTYEQEFREVQATLRHTDDQLVRLTLEDGTELVGTEDHSFLTVDGLEIVPVEGGDVEEGTWMPLSRQLPSTETVVDFDLAEYAGDANNLVIEDEVIRSSSRTEDRYLELDFETGKVFGLYLAEGSFDSGLTLQISNVDDGVKQFLGSWGFNVYDRTCNLGFRPLSRFLDSEFGSGSGQKSLPNWVFDTPDEFRAGLLSGYIDGDGTVNETDVTMMTKSPALADGVQALLRQFGVSSTVKDKFTVYAGEKRRYRRLRVDAFTVPTLADVVELSIEAKAEQLRAAVSDLQDGETYNRKDLIPNFGPVLNIAASEQGWNDRDGDLRADGASVHNLTRQQKAGRDTYNRLVDELDIAGRAAAFGESDILWKRVVEVEQLDEERTVYDLDVAHNDNFVANGVFVHNSNSASVIAERLLDNGYPMLIVDPEGEYYGLKERYELLHVGADDFCDLEVTVDDAERLAETALHENTPVILDVSGYFDGEEAKRLIHETVKHLFMEEKQARKPFLLMIEEMQEYLPQQGGADDLSKLLERVAKRGRKRGLGVLGMSQRPSSVDKDFITQCDWMVWHKLTWETDLQVVANILGSEKASHIEEFEPGEAYLMTDWDDAVEQVKFKRKETHDAGATPGLDTYDRPEAAEVNEDLLASFEADRQAGAVDEVEAVDDGEGGEAVHAEVGDYVDEDPEGGHADLEGADAEDVQAELERQRRRNQLLRDELAELERILDEAEADAAEGPFAAPEPRQRRSSAPRKPAPPTPPRNREGLAGNIVEFVQMLVYLWRLAGYRLRMLFARGDDGAGS